MRPTEYPQRGERALVRRIRELLPVARVDGAAVGFGDDMAPIPGAADLLWTADMLMDGVDFDSRQHDWKTIGHKAMAANLSDCAAMGVQPVAALHAVALANDLSVDDVLALTAGIHECGSRFDCPLVGGDTNSWDKPTVVNITVIGRILPDCAPVRRDGAQPGDRVWVSGPVGGSILGRHLTFTPRVELGIRLARELRPHAMMDISDGVAIDLSRILEASEVGATLSAAEVDAATHDDARRLAEQDGHAARDHALHDGEDFELLVVLPPNADDVAHTLGLLPLGEITRELGLWLTDANYERVAIPPRGWEHFT